MFNTSDIVIEEYNGVFVLRDDLLVGGTKSRFIEDLLPREFNEYVYASPVYGGFQIALAAVCKQLGKKCTIVSAKRSVLYINTKVVSGLGGNIIQVPYGYLSNIEFVAREYCKKNGAYKLNFGADYPLAISRISDTMKNITSQLGFEPDNIFCALGSGTLTKGILSGTVNSKVHAVSVGRKNDLVHERLSVYQYPKSFDKFSKVIPPFPSCRNYDAKAWEILQKEFMYINGSTLFWNVL